MILLNVNSPLPAARNPEAPISRLPEGADFVDDETVLRILAGPVCRRGSLFPNEAFLTAEDTDFAGWHPLEPQPVRVNPPAASATLPELPAPIRCVISPAFSPTPERPASPVWFSVAGALFCLGLLGLAIVSQHQISQPAAKWLPAQPPQVEQATAVAEENPAVSHDLTSTTDRSQ